ncbi:hypothetical protein [Lacipirellula sp.]|uniref:hypothetical protein n=1 Tax=Lacipirellula sp. TaxID=2691419 RepID=UPI003D0B6976
MRHTSPQQLSSPAHQSPERSLAIATAIACLIAVACRLLARLISDHHAELDGFIFLAAIIATLGAGLLGAVVAL